MEEDELIILAADWLDAVDMAEDFDVPGPWWNVGTEDHAYLVKAADADAAKALVTQSEKTRPSILISYLKG